MSCCTKVSHIGTRLSSVAFDPMLLPTKSKLLILQRRCTCKLDSCTHTHTQPEEVRQLCKFAELAFTMQPIRCTTVTPLHTQTFAILFFDMALFSGRLEGPPSLGGCSCASTGNPSSSSSSRERNEGLSPFPFRNLFTDSRATFFSSLLFCNISCCTFLPYFFKSRSFRSFSFCSIPFCRLSRLSLTCM